MQFFLISWPNVFYLRKFGKGHFKPCPLGATPLKIDKIKFADVFKFNLFVSDKPQEKMRNARSHPKNKIIPACSVWRAFNSRVRVWLD